MYVMMSNIDNTLNFPIPYHFVHYRVGWAFLIFLDVYLGVCLDEHLRKYLGVYLEKMHIWVNT